MSNFTAPDEFQIRSLQKKKAEVVDLMASGKGIPWEDRGTRGYLGAFLTTLLSIMFAPNKTLWLMRRPETAKDANGFGLICCVICGLAAVVNSIFNYFMFYSREPLVYVVDPQWYRINTAMGAVATAGVWLIWKIATQIYCKLAVMDMSNKAPPVLLANIVNYILAPCIMALIPGGPNPWFPVGPVLAILWIFGLWIAAGNGRLKLKPGASVIAALLSMVACVAIGFGLMLAISFLWCNLLGNASITDYVPPAGTPMIPAPVCMPSTNRAGAARGRLLARIHRRYQTITEPLKFGSITFDFTRIANPDLVLDDIVAEEDRRQRSANIHSDPLHMPYWAELWDSGAGLAEYLATRRLRAANVLDLGCGMGLAGTMAAALNMPVLMADLESFGLLLAKLNTLPYSSHVRLRRLNWQTDRLSEKFDLILGSDILYERAQWEYLDDFWRHHLAPAGTLLLGEPGRESGNLFVPWITARGWQLREIAQPVQTREKPVRILELKR